MSSSSMEDDESIVPLQYDENYTETCDDEVNDIVPRLERLYIGDNEPLYSPSNDMNIPGPSMNGVPNSLNDFVEAFIPDSNENAHRVFGNDASVTFSADADTGEAVGSQISLQGTDEFSHVLPSNHMNIPGSSMNVVPSSMNNSVEASMSDSNENAHPLYDGDVSNTFSSDADTGEEIGSQMSLSGTDKISQVLPSNYINISGSSMSVVPSSINNFAGASISDSNENVHPVFETDMISANADTEMAVGSQISLSGTDEVSQDFPTNSLFPHFISNASVAKEIHTHPMDTKERKILNTANESAKNVAVENIFDDNPLDLSLKSSTNSGHSSPAISDNENELPSLVGLPEKMKHVDSETGEMVENSNTVLRGGSGSDSKTNTMEQLADAVARRIVFDPDSSKSSYSADISSDDQSNRSSGIILDPPSYTPDIGDVNTASVESKRTRKIAIVPPASVGSKRTRKTATIVPPVFPTNVSGQRPLVIFQPPSKISSSSDGDSKNSSSTGKDSHKTRRKLRKNAKPKYEDKNDAVVKKNVESPPKPIDLNRTVVKKEVKRPSRCKRKNSDTITQTTGKCHKRSISVDNSETADKTHSLNRSRSLSPERDCNVNPPNENSISCNKNSKPRSRKRAISDCYTASRVKFRRPSTSSDDTEN